MEKLNQDQDQGGDASEKSQPEKFDSSAFRQEMAEMNRQTAANVTESVLASVRGLIDGLKIPEVSEPEAPKTTASRFSDFSQEMQDLGIDESQTDAILRLVDKYVQKKAPGLETSILNQVDKNASAKERKAALDAHTKKAYPDLLIPNSALFNEASRIYNDEMETAVKNSPHGTASAVALAASRLGIAPLTLEQLRARDAQNSTGEGPQTKQSVKDEMSQDGLDFAKGLGLDQNKVKEKFKLVQAKYRQAG